MRAHLMTAVEQEKPLAGIFRAALNKTLWARWQSDTLWLGLFFYHGNGTC